MQGFEKMIAVWAAGGDVIEHCEWVENCYSIAKFNWPWIYVVIMCGLDQTICENVRIQ